MNNTEISELLKQASKKRQEFHGNRITFSPKVFIPLTKLCRDRCGYCTFAQPPARVESPYMSPEEVLKVASVGAAAGCSEALFTLGERPEERYPIAKEWLDENGYESTLDYLGYVSNLVLQKTGMLPHANAGALYPEELSALRKSCPSQGMMLESLNPDLECHKGSLDKTPERRLATMKAAGELKIPFTTGILVGIGESRQDRIDALEAIADSHKQYGHIQEVIVQNFLPKPGTAMHSHPPCPPDEFLEAIALARIILPGEIHLQAPPNLTEEFSVLLDAGIDDWGGVSPLTPDFVNPERPWPALQRLEGITEKAGFNLAPRLTVYPEYISTPKQREEWLDSNLHFPVMDLSDSEGLFREPLGHDWYSGASVDPPDFFSFESFFSSQNGQVELNGQSDLNGQSTTKKESLKKITTTNSNQAEGRIKEILAAVQKGEEIEEPEILTLFSARGSSAIEVARTADILRKEIVGDDITWVANRNINYTNICTFKCKFCGFSKGPLSLNLRGKPYLLEMEEIAKRTEEAARAGATEVCLQGGIHPDFDGDYYLNVIKYITEAVPNIHVHGFTALEVYEGARRLNEPLESYLTRLKEAGLRSLPGTAAEILDDEIRDIICPDKVNTEEWLEVHRVAHKIGLRSNITIMFGTVENPIHWARHLLKTRALQKETGGFTEFVGLPFVHMASPIYLMKKSRRGPTFRETVLMHSIARITYGKHVPNIQASWVKLGLKGAKQILMAGGNDLGGTLMNENISRAAGAEHGQLATKQDFQELVEGLNRRLVQRTTLYGPVSPNSEVITPVDLPIATSSGS